jgi:hypothetical protein
MSYKFGVGEYLTRHERKAVVLTDSCPNEKYPLVGFMENIDGEHIAASWTAGGVYNPSTDTQAHNDLVHPKKWSLGNIAWRDDDKGQWVRRGNMSEFFMSHCDPATAAEVVALLNKGEAA